MLNFRDMIIMLKKAPGGVLVLLNLTIVEQRTQCQTVTFFRNICVGMFECCFSCFHTVTSFMVAIGGHYGVGGIAFILGSPRNDSRAF